MLRYGIIGCGMMGQEHIRNIRLVPGVEVAAFYDPDDGQAALTAALVPEAVRAPTLAALLDRSDLDAYVIASPNHEHVNHLVQIAAAAAGTRARAVLVEKPLYVHAGERAALLDLAQRFPAPIWVAMEYRYMPALTAFLAEAPGATGGIKMLSIREHRFPFLDKVGHWNRFNARTGGTLVEKCCHFFDLMRLVMASPPVRVMASGGQAVNHVGEVYAEGVPDIWDNAYVLVDFADGTRAMLELCMFAEGTRFQEVVTAMGPLGAIEARVPGPGRFWPDALPAPVAEVEISPRYPKGPRLRTLPVEAALLEAGDHNGATYFQHRKFAAVASGRALPEVTLLDGVRAVDLGLAAQRAALTGQSVVLEAEALSSA